MSSKDNTVYDQIDALVQDHEKERKKKVKIKIKNIKKKTTEKNCNC